MKIWTLKFVMSVMLEAAWSVIIAEIDCPGARVEPCLFQVIVIGPFAVVGIQLLVDMPKDSEIPLPVFLT